MKEEINLTELIIFLIKRLWIILFVSMFGLTVAILYSHYLAVPQYRSITQILVDQRSGENGGLNTGYINTNIKLIDTYKELITGPAILNEVKAEMETDVSIKELKSRISIEVPDNVQLFNVVVTDDDPVKAAELANTVAKVFQIKITDIMKNIDNVVIVYDAVPEKTPVSPNIRNNLIRGVVIGLVMGMGIILFMYFSDDTLSNAEFVTGDIGWNNLGTIFEAKADKLPKKKDVIVLEKVKNKKPELVDSERRINI